jgi:1-acyl-sn-glycerol-3-phosphate acyltransferase
MLKLFFNQSLCFLARMLFLLTARIRRVGFDRVPHGPYLLVCNHISHFDPPFVGAFYPRKLDFMAMRDLFKNPVLNFIFRSADMFPISRGKSDMEAVRITLERLKWGRIVCMFPEGGLRTGTDSVLEGSPLKPGATILAQMAKVPVRPCLVLGTDRYYSWKLWERIDLVMMLGDEIAGSRNLSGREAREDLNGRMQEGLVKLYTQARQAAWFHEGLIPRTAQIRWAEATVGKKSGEPS